MNICSQYQVGVSAFCAQALGGRDEVRAAGARRLDERDAWEWAPAREADLDDHRGRAHGEQLAGDPPLPLVAGGVADDEHERAPTGAPRRARACRRSARAA